MRVRHVLLVPLLVLGCTSAKESAAPLVDAGSDATVDAAPPDAAGMTDSSIDKGTACEPDLLLVIDRATSMHRRSDGTTPLDTPAERAQSKWYLAIAAIEKGTAAPLDAKVRFGLALYPRDPGAGACVTLSEEITGKAATNTACEAGELTVPLGASSGAAIGKALDPETTRLCESTPISGAIDFAGQKLKEVALAGRKQFVVLLTDGGETCDGDPVKAVQDLAAAGILTYVIGLGQKGVPDAANSGVDTTLLNSLACAGQTATNFATACAKNEAGTGYAPVKPKGPHLYFGAETAADVEGALNDIRGGVCCGCK